MDSPRKVIVGYDLCEDFTQICCYSYKTMEPVLISEREGEDNFLIPTVLCFNAETKQWLIGNDAITCADHGNGTLVKQLLSQVQAGDEIQLYGIKFAGVTLLEKYFRKTLTLVKNYFPTEQITKLVITIRSTEPEFVERIYEALSSLGLERDRVVVMSHTGVYLYYALSQEKSLWANDVGLFDFSGEGLNYYQIKIDRRSNPMVAGIIKKEYSELLHLDILKQKDADPGYIFEYIASNALYKQIISTLYLTGCGFDGSWAQETIKGLCKGRRVFVGQELYTKGACYAAKELAGDGILQNFRLLNDDMISFSVSIKVYCDAAFKLVPLTEAGVNWYDINRSIEVISEGSDGIELELKDIMTKEVKRVEMQIPAFPEREDRMTRLGINLTFRDRDTGVLTINDLGFGEIYRATGETMEYAIRIEDEKEEK